MAPALPSLPESQTRLFHILAKKYRGGHGLFSELDASKQLSNLEQLLRDWTPLRKYNKTRTNGQYARRVALDVCVSQIVNNYACSSANKTGILRHAGGTPDATTLPLVYAHREWRPQDADAYRAFCPLQKLSLDSTAIPWHWKDPYTSVLCLRILVPRNDLDLESTPPPELNPDDEPLLLQYEFSTSAGTESAALASEARTAFLVWTGDKLILTTLRELLECPWRQEGSVDPRLIAVPGKDGENRRYKVPWRFWPHAPLCREWAAARALPTNSQPWEATLLDSLQQLHVRLLRKQLLPTEEGLAYEDWVTVYDRILPGY